MMALRDSKRLRILSLFSGCGGMDLGFEGGFYVHKNCINLTIHPDWVCGERGNWRLLPYTGFKTVFANDIRSDAQIAWQNYFAKRNHPTSTYRLDSIVDLVKEAKQGIQIFPKEIDVITGGFPCQDFSVAGKRLGFNSTTSHNGTKDLNAAPQIESRGQLYMWMRDVISIVKPKIFIAENVKGLVSLADAKKIIESDFREIGSGGYFVVDARVLYAANYGVPQSRERVIFIGLNKEYLTPNAYRAFEVGGNLGKFDPYPSETHSIAPYDNLAPYVTLREIFADLPEPEFSSDLSHRSYSKAKYMGAHCQGQKEISLDKIGPTIRSEHHGNIEFRRLSIEHGGKNYEEVGCGLKERRLSVRECARIQTFPDDYEFVFKRNCVSLNTSSAYQIIGNAVPPFLAFQIAMRLRDNWKLFFGE